MFLRHKLRRKDGKEHRYKGSEAPSRKLLTVEASCKDEARVGQKGAHAYVWAPVGTRPPMVRDNRHDTAYLFGAIYPARGVGAAVITPAANVECMNLHLKEISTQVTPGACAALVCDGAGWHQRGGELESPDNIIMITLPAYSPELNPMENVWAYLRANKLCALVWDSYEAILEACKEAWHFPINDPDRIRSIGSREWATCRATIKVRIPVNQDEKVSGTWAEGRA